MAGLQTWFLIWIPAMVLEREVLCAIHEGFDFFFSQKIVSDIFFLFLPKNICMYSL